MVKDLVLKNWVERALRITETSHEVVDYDLVGDLTFKSESGLERCGVFVVFEDEVKSDVVYRALVFGKDGEFIGVGLGSVGKAVPVELIEEYEKADDKLRFVLDHSDEIMEKVKSEGYFVDVSVRKMKKFE